MEAVDGDGDEAVPVAEGGGLGGDAGAEGAAEFGDGDVGGGEGDAAVGGEAVVGDADVAFAPVAFADAQGGDRLPPRTDAALTDSPAETPENPISSRFRGSRALGEDDDLGVQDEPRGEGPVWTVTASRSPPNACPTVTVAARVPASLSRAMDMENQDGSAPPSGMTYTTRVDGRAASSAARMGGSAECRSATMTGMPSGSRRRGAGRGGGVLLVGAEDGGLQGRVAGLDQVAGAGGVGREPVGDRDDHRVAAGAEAHRQGRSVEQDGIARFGPSHQGRVGERAVRAVAPDRDVQLDRSRPFAPDVVNCAFAPSDHTGKR